MAIRIGINPLTWSNDDMPELGADIPLEVCLSEARQAGYAGIELGHKFPRETAALRPLLERHGLALVSGWYSAQLLNRPVPSEIESLRGHLSLLRDCDCEVMVFAEVTGCVHGDRKLPLSSRPRLDDAQWAALCGGLEEVARHLQSNGLHLAYHHHMGTVIESESEIDRLMSSTSDSVGLLLDTGHLTFAGGDPLSVIERHGERIVHVHCKDVRKDVVDSALAHDQSFLDAVLDGVFTVPGDGDIDFSAVCEVLGEVDYSGWLVVEAEQDPAVAHPLTYATLGQQTISRIVVDAGL